MDNLEKIEKLREKSEISYEEAREILKKCDGDLLDAIIFLEKQGKIKTDSQEEPHGESKSSSDAPKNPKEIAESYKNYEYEKQKNEKGVFNTIISALKIIIKKGCENKFIIKRHGTFIMDIPVLLLIILLIIMFWLILILSVVGLFFGFRYSFSGPDLGCDKVNNVMEKAAKAAEDLKAEATGNNKTQETDSENTDGEIKSGSKKNIDN